MRAMSARPLFALTLTLATASAFVAAIDGCGTDNGDVTGGSTSDAPSGRDGGDRQDAATGTDGGADAQASPDTGADADVDGGSCPQGQMRPATGETCVGFGKGTPCNVACGEYGYACFSGGPPSFASCLLINDNGAFGQTYCCAENKCVAQPDQDGKCTTPGKTHRYQCPPDGTGGNVAPPAGCADGGAGGSAVERFYCCP